MAKRKDFVPKDSEAAKELTRNNHYVPQWYQKGFIQGNKLCYLNLSPDEIHLPGGGVTYHSDTKIWSPLKCFCKQDLYTTFFGPFISDLIERELFGEIDAIGAKAVRAFIDGDFSDRQNHFLDFFRYIDAQKTRTPKGLTWLKEQYTNLDQNNLMKEMQAIQQMHCTMWLEGTKEIVSAKNSVTKFIISDHPVTIYNYACPPGSDECNYPKDPLVALKGSQTIFALDRDHCLILTNYEFARGRELDDPKGRRTNARSFGETIVNTTAFLRDRSLAENQVREINYVIKQRAQRYIAAAQKEWLYPEKEQDIKWESVMDTLLPPENKMHNFGGDMFIGTKTGEVFCQDAFGRTSGDISYLNKELPKGKIQPNSYCPCGQGKKYKACCKYRDNRKRPAWDVYSVRERNIILYEVVNDILGFNQGKEWEDIRRELSDQQIRDIHVAFSDLWPPETDIISLLPKYDGKIRAVYSGLVDVRTITEYVTSATLYFDEIIIHHPFIHPHSLGKEYSPIEKPSNFKEQTLKTVALLLLLHPYIAGGMINMVPDLGIFNRHLRFDAMDSARKRRTGIKINKEEAEKFSQMHDEEHVRTLFSLNRDQKRAQIEKSDPGASEEQIADAIDLMEKKRLEDPFALLQDDLYYNGGQLRISSIAPNYEMSLFLAQITGATIITDSPTRWEELAGGQSLPAVPDQSDWQALSSTIANMEFPFIFEPETVLLIWKLGKFGKMKKVWQNIYDVVFRGGGYDQGAVVKRLNAELLEACHAAQKDLQYLKESFPEIPFDNYQFSASLTPIIPKEGIADQNVLRFLISSGLDDYAKNTPMAIFMNTKPLAP